MLILKPLLCSGFFYALIMTKNARGFRILKYHKNGPQVVYLFQINGTRYMVSVQYLVWSIQVKKRNKEFSEEALALGFYNKVVAKFSS